jgi:hypothetical protein
MILKFNDGEEFDTSGDFRVEERSDGFYVVGEGSLIPVRSFKEGMDMVHDRTPEKVSMSDGDLDCLLSTAFEGGSNYWYWVDFGAKRDESSGLFYINRKPILSNKKIASEENEDLVSKPLTKGVCIDSLTKMKKDYPKNYHSILDGSYDADDADIFLQICLLDEVRYG